MSRRKKSRSAFFTKDGIEICQTAGKKQTFGSSRPHQPAGCSLHRCRGKQRGLRRLCGAVHDTYNAQILLFANSIPNADGGAHPDELPYALTRAINQYARSNSLLKDKDPNISGDDVREGLVCVLSVKLPTLDLVTNQETKLVNTEIEGVVSSVVYEGLMAYFDGNPAITKSGLSSRSPSWQLVLGKQRKKPGKRSAKAA